MYGMVYRFDRDVTVNGNTAHEKVFEQDGVTVVLRTERRRGRDIETVWMSNAGWVTLEQCKNILKSRF